MDNVKMIDLGQELAKISNTIRELVIYQELSKTMLMKLIENDGDKAWFVEMLNKVATDDEEFQFAFNRVKTSLLSALEEIPEKA